MIGVDIVDLFALALVVIEREFFVGLWRRWLGSHGGHRWEKVTWLVGHELLWLAWVSKPWIPWFVQSPSRVAVVLAGHALWCAGVSIWLVYRHNNGGPEGRDGPRRYGWCGYGYPWAYRARAAIPEIRLPMGLRIEPGGWTSVAEVFLGAATGRLSGLVLAGVYIAGRCLAPYL